MNPRNKLRETVVIVLSISVLLIALSLKDSSFSIGDFKFKKVDLLSDIRTRSVFIEAPVTSPILTDSIIRTDRRFYQQKKLNPDAIKDFGNDSLPALACFFESLFQTQQKKKKCRIAYFGDSMIEGDLVTQDLRTSLQDSFGGVGVGFMPVTSIVAGFRQTIFHAFSGNWQTYSLLDQNSPGHVLGITGYDFIPMYSPGKDSVDTGTGSWVRYSAVRRKRLNSFSNVRLFYGKTEGGGNYVHAAGRTLPLNGSQPVNTLELLKSSPSQTVQADFQCSSLVNVFGFSMEGDSGLYLDNFSFRGNSGMPMTRIPQSVLSGLNKQLNYGLVILHYGVNVVSHQVTDFSWYEKGMTEVVLHIKAAMPNASILIISTGDKSFYRDGAYTTDPSVPLVIEAQKRVAEKTGSAFWNLYEAMGGYNSMVKWVQGDTVLANKDYTHPNFRGAKKIADLLYQQLMSDYRAFLKRREYEGAAAKLKVQDQELKN